MLSMLCYKFDEMKPSRIFLFSLSIIKAEVRFSNIFLMTFTPCRATTRHEVTKRKEKSVRENLWFTDQGLRKLTLEINYRIKTM